MSTYNSLSSTKQLKEKNQIHTQSSHHYKTKPHKSKFMFYYVYRQGFQVAISQLNFVLISGILAYGTIEINHY